MKKCYNCGREAKYLFQNGHWCCSKSAQSCPTVRATKSKAMYEKHKNTPLNKLKQAVKDGTVKCYYCDEVAKYIISKGRQCCSKRAADCPNHANFVGPSMKTSYTKDRIKRMIEIGKECQNREDVKEKKSVSMYELHNNDCDRCKTFQTNYKAGRKRFKESLKRNSE